MSSLDVVSQAVHIRKVLTHSPRLIIINIIETLQCIIHGLWHVQMISFHLSLGTRLVRVMNRENRGPPDIITEFVDNILILTQSIWWIVVSIIETLQCIIHGLWHVQMISYHLFLSHRDLSQKKDEKIHRKHFFLKILLYTAHPLHNSRGYHSKYAQWQRGECSRRTCLVGVTSRKWENDSWSKKYRNSNKIIARCSSLLLSSHLRILILIIFRLKGRGTI